MVKPRVTVRVDEFGVMKVDVADDGEAEPTHLVAEARQEPVAPFGDEELKARQHVRHWAG